MRARDARRADRRRLVRARALVAAVVALLALLAGAPAGLAAVPTHWSGTLTVTKTIGSADTSFHASVSGPVTAAPGGGFAWFEPTMLAYSDRHFPADSWCHSTSDLVPPDPAEGSVPVFVEWGRPRADGTEAVPRIISGVQEWSFPRHSWQCLAFNGGELQRIESRQDGAYSLDSAFTCSVADYDPSLPPDVPFAASSYLSPPLAGRQGFDDGSMRFTGSVSSTCDMFGASTGQLTVTYDLVGKTAPDPEVIAVSHDLQVVVHGPQYGSVVGAADAIACGQGGTRCSGTAARGAAVRLAALEATAGRHLFWVGCDEASGHSCLLTMQGPRAVHAYFGYDFVGQWEPPPDGLFDPARKAEIAGNGADAARDGAIGCGLSAALIGGGIASGGIIAVGAGGAATRWGSLVEKAFEETVGNCATGLAGTIFNGVLLKIDPPDPQWRRIALAERYPRPVSSRCLPRGRACAAVDRARLDMTTASARVLELQEALAVAANRYGNAVNARDAEIQALHQATMRATSGLLAEATSRRNARAAALARAIRGLGVRKVVVPKALVARSLRARAGGARIDRAVVARLLRKRLITHRREVAAMLRTAVPERATSVDLLAALARPAATARMRAAARALTLGDVARLGEAVLRDTDVPPFVAERLRQHLAEALACDAGTKAALGQIELLAGARPGPPHEAGLLLAASAREVATHDLTRDEACGTG